MNKICTSISQSQKLIGLGIDVNTADMCYIDGDDKDCQVKDGALDEEDIPAWSLAALLNILPNYHVTNNGITGVVVWSLDTYSKEHDNPVDACYELILKLHDNNLL